MKIIQSSNIFYPDLDETKTISITGILMRKAWE